MVSFLIACNSGRDVVLDRCLERALETKFTRSWSWYWSWEAIRPWSWSWYLWSWFRSWRVGLVKFQDQLCTAPVRYTVQSYLELASSSPDATVKNILCNEQFKSLRHFVSSMYCVSATSAPVERIFSHGGIFTTGHSWLIMYCVT